MRLSFLLLGLCAALPLPADDFTLEQAMADPEWIGPPVQSAFWSLDGRHVNYLLERDGSALRDTWQLSHAPGATPRRLEDAELAGLDAPEPVFDRERRRALLLRNGDVFLRVIGSNELRQLSRTEAAESHLQFSADGRAAHFRSGDDWIGHDFASGASGPVAQPRGGKDPEAAPEPDLLRDTQLRLFDTLRREREQRDAQRTRDLAQRAADPSRVPTPLYLGADLSIVDSALAPDALHLLVVTAPSNAQEGRAGKMPRYVTESGYEEIEDVRVRVGRNAPTGHRLWLVELATRTPRELALDALPGIDRDPLAELRREAKKDALEGLRAVRVDALRWNDDGSMAAVQLRAVDNKDRWLATLDPRQGRLRAAHRLTDPAWINWNFNDFGWMPDGRRLWLLSEESGWSHLYLLEPGRRARALTQGRWEVSAPRLSIDGRRFYFVCNRAWPGDYELCALDLDGDPSAKGRRAGATAAVRELTALDGVESFAEAPDGSRLLVTYSGSWLPSQLALVESGDGRTRVLTDTRTATYRRQQWIGPDIVQVPSRRSGEVLWSKFYRPRTLEPGRRYPIVLFVHGAGYTQNTHAKFPYYFREQMFHHLLVQQGYLVLDIDYRASEGYGRDWRTAIYRRMGHPELEDLIDGVDWLVREQQGDRDNVGVYGGSYGGFMSLMALFRAPEVFHVGAALRPVTDWTQYNHGYTSNILNTPELDPEAFLRSSPIEHAAGLRGHLLIAHGMLDDNVFFQDSVRLAQRLIELRKPNWELASYPLERHGYVHPESWLDQYRRVQALFERVLKD